MFKPTKNAWPPGRFGVSFSQHNVPMKETLITRGIVVAGLMFGLAVAPALFAEEKKEEKKAEAPKPKPKSVFKDKALEEGVRKFVFAKRYNKEPLLEADLIHLSTIKVTKAGSSWISSFLGGEGLVCRFSGQGKLYCQTHNPPSFGKHLGPKLRPAKG